MMTKQELDALMNYSAAAAMVGVTSVFLALGFFPSLFLYHKHVAIFITICSAFSTGFMVSLLITLSKVNGKIKLALTLFFLSLIVIAGGFILGGIIYTQLSSFF